jgi:hypothetical protein
MIDWKTRVMMVPKDGNAPWPVVNESEANAEIKKLEAKMAEALQFDECTPEIRETCPDCTHEPKCYESPDLCWRLSLTPALKRVAMLESNKAGIIAVLHGTMDDIPKEFHDKDGGVRATVANLLSEIKKLNIKKTDREGTVGNAVGVLNAALDQVALQDKKVTELVAEKEKLEKGDIELRADWMRRESQWEASLAAEKAKTKTFFEDGIKKGKCIAELEAKLATVEKDGRDERHDDGLAWDEAQRHIAKLEAEKEKLEANLAETNRFLKRLEAGNHELEAKLAAAEAKIVLPTDEVVYIKKSHLIGLQKDLQKATNSWNWYKGQTEKYQRQLAEEHDENARLEAALGANQVAKFSWRNRVAYLEKMLKDGTAYKAWKEIDAEYHKLEEEAGAALDAITMAVKNHCRLSCDGDCLPECYLFKIFKPSGGGKGGTAGKSGGASFGDELHVVATGEKSPAVNGQHTDPEKSEGKKVCEIEGRDDCDPDTCDHPFCTGPEEKGREEKEREVPPICVVCGGRMRRAMVEEGGRAVYIDADKMLWLCPTGCVPSSTVFYTVVCTDCTWGAGGYGGDTISKARKHERTENHTVRLERRHPSQMHTPALERLRELTPEGIAYILWVSETRGGTFAEFKAYMERTLKAEHHGDCTHQPNTCERCYSEELVREAKDIAERIASPPAPEAPRCVRCSKVNDTEKTWASVYGFCDECHAEFLPHLRDLIHEFKTPSGKKKKLAIDGLCDKKCDDCGSDECPDHPRRRASQKCPRNMERCDEDCDRAHEGYCVDGELDPPEPPEPADDTLPELDPILGRRENIRRLGVRAAMEKRQNKCRHEDETGHCNEMRPPGAERCLPEYRALCGAYSAKRPAKQ